MNKSSVIIIYIHLNLHKTHTQNEVISSRMIKSHPRAIDYITLTLLKKKNIVIETMIYIKML